MSKSENPETSSQLKSYAVISISDNGRGISEQALKHVFEPFYTNNDNYESLGLGLSLAYSTMQAHGGSIEINSFEGIGTNVRLYFPIMEF